MPDPTGQTISASQSPALWNASPYVTKWMLWQHFKNGIVIDQGGDARKNWGTKLQPLIIQQVAEEKRLEVIPNADDSYIRRGDLGYTADATIICPDRGPGSLEIKCVFDYNVWAINWGSGRSPPRHNEIQLQQQMYCGDGERSYGWGLIAVWLAAEIVYFERRPIPKLWSQLLTESRHFMESVKLGVEPDPFGAAAEVPLLTSLFPTVEDSVLDLSGDPAAVKIAQDLSMYADAKLAVNGNKPIFDQMRIKLLGVAREYQRVVLPNGYGYRVQKSGKGKTIIETIPED